MRGRLSEAMKKEGAIGALSVCREAAQPVTRDVSAARGVDVRRTALRVRNPKNAPSARELENSEELC